MPAEVNVTKPDGMNVQAGTDNLAAGYYGVGVVGPFLIDMKMANYL